MMPICHHLTKEEMDRSGVTACGTSYWLYGTTSWPATTCPYCLATRAEVCTTGAQLADNELGTRTIISGGEVFEIREGVSNQQWFENINPLEY